MNVKKRRASISDGLYLKASFTVELSLLMGLILAMLAAILLTGFYLHDQACLQGTACELTAMAGNLQLYPDRNEKLGARKDKRMKTVIWAKNTGGDCSAGKDYAEASLQGSFYIPGFTAGLLTGGVTGVHAKWAHTLYHPASIIRKAKGAAYLLGTVLE